MNRPVLIGIAGGTGSGKTTIAQTIFDRGGADRIEWISHDSYYRDFGHLPLDGRHAINFDHPNSLETPLLVSHLETLKEGRAVKIPVYDFTTHLRSEELREILPKKVIMVEGILVLAEAEIRQHIDIKLFVDTPSDIRFLRRLRRDIEKRGRSVDSVIDQYLTTVRPMHEEFVEPSKRWADLIIPEGGKNDVAIEAIVSRVEQLLL